MKYSMGKVGRGMIDKKLMFKDDITCTHKHEPIEKRAKTSHLTEGKTQTVNQYMKRRCH